MMPEELIYVIQPIFADQPVEERELHAEILSLIESAGAAYAGTIRQTIREINPATVIGEGKLTELKELLEGLDVTVLFNGELSPSQTLNISKALGDRKVIDRTTLILDIFAHSTSISIPVSREREEPCPVSAAGSERAAPARASSKPTAGISVPGSMRSRKNSRRPNSGGRFCPVGGRRIASRQSPSSAIRTRVNRRF